MDDDIERELRNMESERLASVEAISRTVAIISGRVDSVLTKVSQIQDDIRVLLERSTPRSNCAFCSSEDNVDAHHTGRCHRYSDPVSRAMRASELHLCRQCLRPEHGTNCKVSCSICRGDHNTVLYSTRAGPSGKRLST
ncbi:unnamed protein product [Nippostrongylus brasiliensis]|uniref:RING-type domain-containing protein n=1 Tax=Nippostrongylus brasiliensis TaxID=27835 RepID=A0A0N4XZ30_NIPBR|nr:unnamed protein product [Nippostrongylus brasiliensis]